ncbi:ABC transporter substrate-binding protein [Sporosarcina koreensis]|uniref:ABC transporter substrate-binding protein n=1 Tax=Sporosarcina koreensis TaxID=334735 RepID=A0ABW0U076_9BACL
MKKTFTLLFLTMIVFALILSGCGGKKAKKGNREIIVAAISEPDSVDVHRTSSMGDANSALYDPLMKYDDDGNIVGNLVKEYTVSPDGKEVTFELKEGVEFHSRKPVNAEAVKKSFERLMESSPFKTNAGDIESIEVVSEYVFKIRWVEPFAPFFTNATSDYLSPIDVSVLDSNGEGFEKNPSATGALKLKEIKRGDSLVYEPSDKYDWGKDGPGFDKVTFRFIPDEETRILEFKKGNVDVLESVPYQYIEELEKQDGVTIVRVPNYVLSYLGWNNKKPLFQDVRVRQAIAMAIDRDAIISNTFRGEAKPVFGPLPPATFGYNEKIEEMARSKYAKDLDKAKQLLSEAGWKDKNKDGIVMKDGKPFKVDLWVDDDPANQRAAQIIQNQLKEIGINLSISVKESATIIDQTPKGAHEMLLWSFGWLDADVLNFLLFGEEKSKRLHYEVKEIYDLLEKGAVEMDQEKRLKLYEDAQKLLVEQSPWVPLYVKENITAIRNFEEFEIHPKRNLIMWENVKVKK